MQEKLTNREKEVLKFIVDNFIRFGTPVGSRNISKFTDLNLSSATIRNVMSDLEDKELLETPHTSAGRMPTDKGYRYYVDELMKKETLNKNEIEFLRAIINETSSMFTGGDEFFNMTSRILSRISHQLAVVTQPFLSSGVLEKLEVFSISSGRLLLVINIKSGYVKTLIMEVNVEIPSSKIERITGILNERLRGLSLLEIKETFSERVSDYIDEEPELFQMFINSIEKIRSEEEMGGKIYISGTSEIISQPEFEKQENFKSIVKIAENKDLVIHIFHDPEMTGKVSIKIGNENSEKELKNYSIVCANYKVGDVEGKIGIIGPKRLNYAKMISLMEYTSKLISETKINM